MSVYWKVRVDSLGKQNTRDVGQIFNQETKTFASEAEVRAWLKETYGKKKRQPMYVDTKDGQTKKVGWVIHLGWQRDWSHGDSTRWLQEDWVAVTKVHEETASFFK